MFLTQNELTTHLRQEDIAAITRDDPVIAASAIDSAISEAKGYLERYDTDTVFAQTGNNRHQLLLMFVKDIATWHLINIVAPNVNMTARKDRYNRAIEWLKDVQRSRVKPDLPLLQSDTDTDTDLTRYGSGDRNNYDW